MQVQILSGIYTDNNSDFRTSYPRNMVPVPKSQGVSEGYLRPADGIELFGTGPGVDRGAVRWGDFCYRVMGTKLVQISSDGATAVIGDVGGLGQVAMDYSFDRLAVVSSGKLYYLQGGTLSQVTDPDLGVPIDVVWADGYFMLTDGDYLIVTELTNPASIDPLKYGSSEADPDKIVALLKLRNEIYVLNRNTIEVFQDTGGSGFPYSRIEGAQMMRGCIGTAACAVFMESIAWVGGGRNEQTAVWIGNNGQTSKISTREIEQILLQYTEAELSGCVMEVRVSNAHQFLYVHLPDRTIVYDGAGSQVVGEPVWFELTSSVTGSTTYRARNFVWCYDKWLCGDPTTANHGYLTNTKASHYGDLVGWEFSTPISYNAGKGAMFHRVELVCLTGRAVLGGDPRIATSYSLDGVQWSQDRWLSAGKSGETLKRLAWLQQGYMRNWRIQKFRGTSDAMVSVSRLEIDAEGLNV